MKGQVAFSTKEKTLLEIRETAKNILKTLDKLSEKINKFLGSLGVVGIVISEIYSFFTWHVSNITGKINIYDSIRLAFPEFYIGLVVSLIMVIIYFFIDKIMN